MSVLDQVVSIAEAAEALGRDPASFRKAAQRGSLEALRIGRQWVTTHDAAAEYVARVAAGRALRRPTRDYIARAEATLTPRVR